MPATDHRNVLLSIYQAALDRVHGREAVRSYLLKQELRKGTHAVAIGKAACAMAQGAVDVLGEQAGDILVITKTGHLEDLCSQVGIACIEADHPVPDERSLEAGQGLLRFLSEHPQGPFLFLISGGASSLVEVLPDGIGLEQLRELTRWLLSSGLPIQDMNRIRRSLSCIKGGKLLNHLDEVSSSQVLLISDVMGDDLAAIGSGLLYPTDSGINPHDLPATIQTWWQPCEVMKSGRHIRHTVVASLDQAMGAAANAARAYGYSVTLHEDKLEGDAALTGKELAHKLKDAQEPGIHIWGGETTVTLPEHPGRGGRNQHLALSAAVELDGAEGLYLLAAGTDGTDGNTIGRGQLEGLVAVDNLAAADAGSFLDASGDLISTGPTGTNVMDLVISLKV
jgi:hydroxypyruvate reductase